MVFLENGALLAVLIDSECRAVEIFVPGRNRRYLKNPLIQ
jgi:hypothetical protein